VLLPPGPQKGRKEAGSDSSCSKSPYANNAVLINNQRNHAQIHSLRQPIAPKIKNSLCRNGKRQKSDRFHLAMIKRINFKAIAYLYPLQYGKIGLQGKEHWRTSRRELRAWLRTVLPGCPFLRVFRTHA